MRSVLISIQPCWCRKIVARLKTFELRKTAPKLKTPFKCYIYCTMSEPLLHTEPTPFCKNIDDSIIYRQHIMNGKVIGEFVCDFIEPVASQNRHTISEASCVPLSDMYNYAGPKGLDGLKAWHISNLTIYDEPKELSDFFTSDNTYNNSFGRGFETEQKRKPITRPPQSWFYIESV